MSVELPTSRADLDGPSVRATVENLAAAREHERMWRKRAENYEKELRGLIGGHTEGYVNGEHRFSYRHTGPFASRRFAEDHPDLFRKYSYPKVVDELNVEELASAEPHLYAEYRSRRFLLNKD